MNKNIKTKALEGISDTKVITWILCGAAAVLLSVVAFAWKTVYYIASK